jgi:hypothetical protein
VVEVDAAEVDVAEATEDGAVGVKELELGKARARILVQLEEPLMTYGS